MAKPPEKCIFCGFEGELTGEHIISKRYHRDIIPRTMESYKTLRAVEMPGRSNFTFGKRVTDPRDWKVRCVCEQTCNNGWMRTLKDKAEPILTPLFKAKGLAIVG
jgi:hypothetical protein